MKLLNSKTLILKSMSRRRFNEGSCYEAVNPPSLFPRQISKNRPATLFFCSVPTCSIVLSKAAYRLFCPHPL